MGLDVKVRIDLNLPIPEAVSTVGTPLILEENASAAKAYAECSSLADVVTAGFATTTKVYKVAQTIFMQDNPPAKIAVCATEDATATWLGVTANVLKDWRQLIVVTESTTTAISVSTIMTTIESLNGKMYFADLAVDDTTTPVVTGIKRTVLFYCASSTDHPSPVAALVGATAGKTVGSFTYKNLILKGIAPQDLTDTQITAIHNKGGMTFVKKAGDNVTSNSKVAGGDYIDIIDSEDYIISSLEYKTQKLLNKSDKIPYTDSGIAQLEAVAIDVMKTAYNMGIIGNNDDGTPGYTVSYSARTEQSEGDRAIRKYAGGTFSFILAGAVETVEIKGEITI